MAVPLKPCDDPADHPAHPGYVCRSGVAEHGLAGSIRHAMGDCPPECPAVAGRCSDCPHECAAACFRALCATARGVCGAWGGCPLPAGHNMGQVDIPENHGRPVRAVSSDDGEEGLRAISDLVYGDPVGLPHVSELHTPAVERQTAIMDALPHACTIGKIDNWRTAADEYLRGLEARGYTVVPLR